MRDDPLGRLLEAGLAAVVVLAPLPFGAVIPAGRLGLEIAAGVLVAIWAARGLTRGNVLPARGAVLGVALLVAWAVVQIVPWGATAVGAVSPLALELRRDARPAGDAAAAEARLLDALPAALDAPPALSLDPPGSASALRTGTALAGLLLVAASVAAARGVRVLAAALLCSAAFQGLYGVLVLVSGHPMIWHVPKQYYLDCATGSFVGRTHFAGFLALALPGGLALALARRRDGPAPVAMRERILDLLGHHGSRALLVALLVAVALAGLFLSFSRAGIALGLGALVWTAVAARRQTLRHGAVVVVLLVAVAAVPLLQIGADRLAARVARTADEFTASGGRAAVWRDTIGMVRALPIAGAGFGTFAQTYPLFRSPGVRARFDHAHNDVLQFVAEGGIVGVLALAPLVAALLPALLAALAGRAGPVAAGLAAGLAAALLHALVDFNFHIPSNAAAACIVAGALLGTPWAPRR